MGQLTVRGKGWDSTIGGWWFDQTLTNLLAQGFNDKVTSGPDGAHSVHSSTTPRSREKGQSFECFVKTDSSLCLRQTGPRHWKPGGLCASTYTVRHVSDERVASPKNLSCPRRLLM